jgi:hypothetical protein
MHGLLTDDMAVYTEDNKGNLQYNYMYVDALFDFLHSIGMKPFVELGFDSRWQIRQQIHNAIAVDKSDSIDVKLLRRGGFTASLKPIQQ